MLLLSAKCTADVLALIGRNGVRCTRDQCERRRNDRRGARTLGGQRCVPPKMMATSTKATVAVSSAAALVVVEPTAFSVVVRCCNANERS